MREGGFLPTSGCPQLYHHPQRCIWSVVHGDDFLSVAEKDQTRWLETFLRKGFKVKDFEAIGPGAGQELSFLNRTVRFWASVGFEVQPDPRLLERTVEDRVREEAGRAVAAAAVPRRSALQGETGGGPGGAHSTTAGSPFEPPAAAAAASSEKVASGRFTPRSLLLADDCCMPVWRRAPPSESPPLAT